jgi:glycosyltransferase involved in cell wall biosynthesis
MADDRPLVSIGLPVYNGEEFLRQTLDSLLVQTYENLELIVSDNASTDGTEEICREYAARDQRVRYYRNAVNCGAAANANRVFVLSSGDYFMWASDEDYWAPAYVSSCMDVLANSDRIVLAGSWSTFVDAETEEIILTDKGFSTVGLSACERFKLHKLTIHSGAYVAAIFHGIYKRSPLSSVMPVWNIVLADQLLLARLCFLGEFYVVPELLMMKRRKKVSINWEEWHEEIGLNRPLLTNFPYFIRDVLYQKIIFQADNLTLKEKVSLSRWSLAHHDHTFQELESVARFSTRRVWNLARGVLWRDGAKQ